MQLAIFFLGAVIIILTFWDFFHTTLSGKGFWVISGTVNGWLSNLILSYPSKFGFKYSGVAHILLSVGLWLVMLLSGVFMIFASGEDMVVTSGSREPATLVERFYFTCYIISTLGIGDLEPGNEFSKVLTGIFSFKGFILLTIAMTYLLSVISAVLQKKQLALYISSMGQNIEDLYLFCRSENSYATLRLYFPELQKLILQNASSYGYFPIVHYFLSWNRKTSVEVQLASLYEVLIVLREMVKGKRTETLQIDSLLSALDFYLMMGIQEKEKYESEQQELASLREFWAKKGLPYHKSNTMDLAMTASLKSAGWKWKEVYSMESN